MGATLKFNDGTEASLAQLIRNAGIAPTSITGTAGSDELMDGLGADTISAGAGNDVISLRFGDNIVDGGAGNDYILDGAGDDTLLFSVGMGADRVQIDYRPTGGINTVRMAPGISPTQITVTNIDGLKLAHSNGVDNLSLVGWDEILPDRQVNRHDLFVTFADGTVWNADDLRARTLVATANADTLSGTSSIDVIRGGDGNDQLIGSHSPYAFSADLLYGENGNDQLDAGPVRTSRVVQATTN